MKNIEIYNTLNIDKDSSSIVATFTQEDDAVMEFKLFKDGQEIVLKDQTISLGAERKDGAVIEQEDGFLIKENNVLNITLKKNIIQVVGVVKIQLYLKDKSGEMASNTFNIRVNKKLLGAENVEATNDIKSLNTLVLELKNNTNKLIDDTKAKADKLLNGLQETGDNLSDTVKAKTDKVIEDTKAEVDNIKKDYEGLKKVVIDENIGIKLQKDVTELQNGLKSNQSLEYSGSSITANDTLEGRTEGMRIGGMTLLNLVKMSKGVKERVWFRNDRFSFNPVGVQTLTVLNLTSKILRVQTSKLNNEYSRGFAINANGTKVITLNSDEKLRDVLGMKENGWIIDDENQFNEFKKGCIILLGDYSNISNISYFEDIKSFGEAEKEGDKYKISILSCGKNILKPLKNYSTINGFNLNNILKNGVQYTVTNTKNQLVKIAEFKDADTFLGQSTNGKFTFTFDNSKQQKLYIWKKYDSQVAELFTNEDIDFVMIEEGTGTIFEPYKEDKKDILISAPLRSVYDVQDIMYEDNVQVKVYREAGQYTFTGEEAITKENTLTNITRFYIDIPCKNIINTRNIICNNFNSNGTWWDRDEIGMYWDTSIQGRLWFHIKNGEFNDFEAFRNFLKANKTTIVYQLDKPVIEVIENCIDIDLDTYESITYVNTLNSLPGELDFKVPSNIGSSLQNLAKEVNNIWDVINNLLVPSLIDTKKKIAMSTIKNNLK
ncbi:hypothetical protein R2D14_001310 [Clostridium perfringens]|nr:hypothetical protein [Clostridium perfringens]